MSIDNSTSQKPLPHNAIINIEIEGPELEQVCDFVHLGLIILCNSSKESTTTNRIAKASVITNALNKVWYTHEISLNKALTISNNTVPAILFY